MHSIIPAALRHTVVALPCNLIPAGLPHERDLPPLWDPEREGGDHEC